MKTIDIELTDFTDWCKDHNVIVERRVNVIPRTLSFYMWEMDEPKDKTSMEISADELVRIADDPNKFYELLNTMYSNLMTYKNK